MLLLLTSDLCLLSGKVPFQSDPSRWVGEADNELKLYFDLNFTRPGITQSEILVILGKLMLFHEDSPVLSGKSPGSDVNRDESNNGTRNELNLTVFQFLKPLKRNRKGIHHNHASSPTGCFHNQSNNLFDMSRKTEED